MDCSNNNSSNNNSNNNMSSRCPAVPLSYLDPPFPIVICARIMNSFTPTKCSVQLPSHSPLPHAQEIDILRGLRHENIIQMLDAFETKTDFCVVTGE